MRHLSDPAELFLHFDNYCTTLGKAFEIELSRIHQFHWTIIPWFPAEFWDPFWFSSTRKGEFQKANNQFHTPKKFIPISISTSFSGRKKTLIFKNCFSIEA